jgi:hypothetical protein
MRPKHYLAVALLAIVVGSCANGCMRGITATPPEAPVDSNGPTDPNQPTAPTGSGGMTSTGTGTGNGTVTR